MHTVQLLTFENKILASFITRSKQNQIDLYLTLAGLPETSGSLLLALEQVFKMLNNGESPK